MINIYNTLLFFSYGIIQFLSKKGDYNVISSINSLLILSTTNYLLITDYDRFTEPYNYNLDEVNVLYKYPAYFFLSYILYDIYYSVVPFNKEFLLHAFLSLLGVLYTYYTSTLHYTPSIFIIQTSSIFLIRMKKSKLYKYLFGLSFIMYRIIYLPILTKKFIKNNENQIITSSFNKLHMILFILLSFNILNFYWLIKIIKMLKR